MERSIKSTNIFRIYDRLKQSPVTLEVLFDWVLKAGIKVSRRTLYRYLNNLASTVDFRGEKLVIYNNEFNKKVWKIEFKESESLLNQFDINSYYILRHFIPKSLSGPRAESLKNLDELVYSASSKSHFQQNVDANNLSFLRTDYFDASYSERHHLIIEEIISAIQHHQKIRVDEFTWDIKLMPEGFKNGMHVLPLKLLFHFGLMHICVFFGDLQKVAVLPLSDNLKISVINETFNPAPYKDILAEYLDKTFGVLPNIDDKVYDVEIEFAGNTGEYIRFMNWHKSQRFSPAADNNNIIMHLHCGINRELVGFIMFFLNNARIIKPARLRQIVLDKLRKTISNYEKNLALVYKSNLVAAG
jgi:predicted DNA-binding transcriptional regulator YafY